MVESPQTQKITLPQKPMYISFCSEINQNSAEYFMAIIADQFNKGTRDFYILFSSPGGFITSGITLYNYLRSLPAKITMHNIGLVDSIGNVIFLAGEQRYAVPNSSFLFHGVFYNITHPIRFDEKSSREQLKSIEREQKLINDIIIERTKLSKEDVNSMFLNAETKTPAEAKDLGIINDVKLVDIPKDAQIMQVILQQRPWQ